MSPDAGARRAHSPVDVEQTVTVRAGLVAQADMLATGAISSVRLTEGSLAAIAETQPVLNAFRCVRNEAALREAAEADRRLADGERLPLLGVPVAIKDDTDILGETTEFGCEGDFKLVTREAEIVTRLRAAGAVIVGKTNTPEIGQWPVTAGPGFGVTRNPWNTDHTPGGSSGGTAAAVASGVVAAAVGSDGAGSIRIPAAWTNLVGIKPQRGRVSTWPDREAFNGLTVSGPLARTVGDAALLLDVISGSHLRDLHHATPPDESFFTASRRLPGRLRIALSTRAPFCGFKVNLDPRVRERMEHLAATLSRLGHEVVEADPSYGLIGATFMPRSMAGVREWTQRVPSARLDPRTRHNAAVGRVLGGPLLRAARAAEPLLHRRVGAIFERVDVLLVPTTAAPPLAADALNGLSSYKTDRTVVSACPYAWAWNVLGWPGINVPAGLTAEGVPVGAQLLGPAESEPLLISLAAQLEGVERWQDRWPTIVAKATANIGTPAPT